MVNRLTILLVAGGLGSASLSAVQQANEGVAQHSEEARGRVWVDAQGVIRIAAGAAVRVRCPAGDPEGVWSTGATTQEDGSFLLITARTCDTMVRFEERDSNSIEVFFTPEGLVNLQLTPSEDGWVLVRR